MAKTTVPIELSSTPSIVDNGNATAITIDSSQNVGIGTSPTSVLDVAGTTPTLTIKDTQNKSWTSSDTTLGELAFRTSDTSGIGEHNVAFVRAVNEVVSSTTPSGALSFGISASNANASEAMRIDSSGNVGIGTSSPSTFNVVPADDLVIGDGTGSRGITIYGSTTSTGMLVFADGTATGDQYKGLVQYYHAEDRMTFHTNNLERIRIDSSGNLLVGTTSAVTGNSLATVSTGITASSSTSPALQLYCSGAGSNEKYWRWTSKTTGEIRLEQVNDAYSSPTERMRITSTGQFLMPGVYNDTTADAANVNVRSDGLQRRSTSSMRYKNSITDATHGLAEVMQLRSVTYKGNNDGDTIFGGLIAEEVDEVGLTEFVEYDNEGRPDALRYQHMVSLLTKAIQEQQTIIEDLKARITALEGN